MPKEFPIELVVALVWCFAFMFRFLNTKILFQWVAANIDNVLLLFIMFAPSFKLQEVSPKIRGPP